MCFNSQFPSSYLPPPSPRNQYPAMSELIHSTKPVTSLCCFFPGLFWVLRGGFERAACTEQKYFLRVWEVVLSFEGNQDFQLILILFLMFMGTSLTCLTEFRVWIFGRFLFEPSLAVLQNVQIAHIKSE